MSDSVDVSPWPPIDCALRATVLLVQAGRFDFSRPVYRAFIITTD